MQTRHLGAVAVAWVAGALALALACSGRGPVAPRASSERIAIAVAEARRAAGAPALIGLAHHRDAQVRGWALRGLGRVGSPDALAALRDVIAHGDGRDATAAAAALGIAGALDTIEAGDAPAVTAALIALAPRTDVDHAIVIEALGRAGDAGALGALTEAVAARDPRVAATAALALGRFGRRGLAIDEPARAALVRATAAADRDVRLAAIDALAREKGVVAPAAGTIDPVAPALIARMRDDDAAIRAAAATALGKRELVATAPTALVDALADGDWRVGVSAARALGRAGAPDDARDALAAFVARQWARVAGRQAPPSAAHVLLEGLRGLAGHADRALVAGALDAIAQAPAPAAGEPGALDRAWAQCLADAAIARSAAADQADRGLAALATCGGGALPAFERDVLLADVVAAGAGGTASARWARLAPRIASTDPRVAAAAITAAPAVWSGLTGDERAAAVAAVVARLASTDDAVSEAAADAVAAYLADAGNTGAARDGAAAALVERARGPIVNPEVAITLLGDLEKAGALPGAADACDAARADPSPAVAAAARHCVKVLRGADPGPQAPRVEPPRPPVDPADVLGRHVAWTIETSRGRIVIALDPDLAPWHVAAIVALTRARFYDGLVFHRVVPDFVVQGGDPTGTGAGGPGYTLPAEPGSLADGAAFTTGAVGIADAGKDTGGSQWFVMHDRAPHLDGRYTRIGRVVSGQEVVDALQVDDRITRATVDVE